MIQRTTQKLFFSFLMLPVSSFMQAYTITNIDTKNTIYAEQNVKYFPRKGVRYKILKPGESIQLQPDWADALLKGYRHGEDDFSTSKVTFFIDDKNKGLNVLRIGDFRNPKGAAILADPATIVSIYFSPITRMVEYQLVWQENQCKRIRQSPHFESWHVQKAVLKTQKEQVTEERLGKLTEQERKESIIISQQPALRELVGEYITGEKISPENRAILQAEIEQEQLPTAPGGPTEK